MEVCRDIADAQRDFRRAVPPPGPYILSEWAIVPGTDGRKMSKSYGNTLGLFEPEKSLKSKIMSIQTDSTPVEAPKDPDKCKLFALVKPGGVGGEKAEIEQRYRAGGIGYGKVKKRLLALMLEYFREARERRRDLEGDMQAVRKALDRGAEKARASARPNAPGGARGGRVVTRMPIAECRMPNGNLENADCANAECRMGAGAGCARSKRADSRDSGPFAHFDLPSSFGNRHSAIGILPLGGRLIVGQSGGCAHVMNASLSGVVFEARRSARVTAVWARGMASRACSTATSSTFPLNPKTPCAASPARPPPRWGPAAARSTIPRPPRPWRLSAGTTSASSSTSAATIRPTRRTGWSLRRGARGIG